MPIECGLRLVLATLAVICSYHRFCSLWEAKKRHTVDWKRGNSVTARLKPVLQPGFTQSTYKTSVLKHFHFINSTPCIKHASVSSVSAWMQKDFDEAHVYAHKRTHDHGSVFYRAYTHLPYNQHAKTCEFPDVPWQI